jgi:hypothetical protein
VLERRRRAQRATLKNLGAIPLPASLGSFFGSGAVGGGAAVAGMSIGAKVATVLATAIVATGIGREVVQASAAKNPASTPAQSGLVQGTSFSPVSALTNGRAVTNPLAARLTSKKLRTGTLAARQPGHSFKAIVRHSGAGETGSSGSSSAAGGSTGAAGQAGGAAQQVVGNVVHKLPPLPPPPVQVPQIPTLPVEVPPVPPVPVPPIPPPPLP